MTKKEFLDTLGGRLVQTLPQEKVMEHIRYYDNYLVGMMAQGFSEEEAVAQLGDPLLIARTIMDTGEETGGRKVVYEEMSGNESGWRVEEEKPQVKHGIRRIQLQSKGGCLLAAVIAIVVLALVLWLVGSVLSFVLPILLPVLLIGLVISYFKQR